MIHTENRHPAVREYLDRFETAHLPEGLPRQVMQSYRDLVETLLGLLPDDSPALTSALHDLWRSKNEAVLASVRVVKGGSAAGPVEADRG